MMGENSCSFRFYAALNDFLSPDKRQTTFDHPFEGQVSVKHLIESLGVPHAEIDLILANSQPVDFSYQVKDEDRISVYPPFRAIDLSPIGRLRPLPPNNIRFVLDNHLGQLARYLRLIGFDTLYKNDYMDPVLAEISSLDGRILLTKDRGLLMRNQVVHGYCVRATDPEQQLVEVVSRFDLGRSLNPFHRCLACNGLLKAVDKEEIIEQLQPDTRQYYDIFRQCDQCKRIYWKGSHYRRMHHFLQQVLDISL